MNSTSAPLSHTPTLLLVHGWGFGPGLWRPVLRTLNNPPCWRVDLGFFAPPMVAPPPGEGPLVAVGHSLGFLWLLERLAAEREPLWPGFRQRLRGLVAVGGFSRFAAGPAFPAGVPERVLRRMINRLQEHPAALLSAFRQQGGLADDAHAPPFLPGGDVTRLVQGLAWLAQWDRRELLSGWQGPLLALASRDDMIVPPSLTAACFPAGAVAWREEGGHILPLTAPAWCATQLARFLATMGDADVEA